MAQASGAADTRWREDLARLCADGRPNPLAIVDLLRPIPRYTRRVVTDAAAITNLRFGTISSYRWIAANVPADVQRDDLGLAHHRVVATLPPAEQRRRLAEAAAERLSAVDLRRRIEAEGAG